MIKIKADKLIKANLDDAFRLLDPVFDLEFNDGTVISTTATATLYSLCLWGPLDYVGEPPTLECHADSHGVFTNAWNTKIISAVYRIAFDKLNSTDSNVISELMRVSFNSINVLYNLLVTNTRGYKMCVDAVSVRELFEDEFVAGVRKMVQSKKISVSSGYGMVTKQIADNPRYRDNSLARMMYCRGVKIDQVYQCIIARGFLTDVDGHVFREPVLTSFFGGLKYLYDYTVESRSAVKSLASSESLIAESEYFSRKLRMICFYIEKVLPGDCGTKRYLPWLVRPPVLSGDKSYRGDLPGLKGKIYLDDDGVEKMIGDDDGHLSGRIIQMRSPSMCNHIKDRNVCSVCYGGMSFNAAVMNNIGYRSAIRASVPIIQSIISVKHDDTIGAIIGILLNDDARSMFTESSDLSGVSIDAGNDLKDLKLVISKNESPGMIDLNNNPDSSDIRVTVQKMSSISIISFYYGSDAKSITDLEIVKKPNYCILSDVFIAYIAKKGLTFNSKGNYIVDMSDWHHEDPILIVPSVFHGKINDVRQIQKLIEGRAEDRKNRMKPGAMIDLLRQLYDCVSSTIDINISPIEIIMTAISVASYDDYSIPSGEDDNMLGMLKTTINKRSLGAVIGFEHRLQVLMSASAHNPVNRISHPLDALVMPKETVAGRRKSGRL